MEKLLSAFRDKAADTITPQDLERHLAQTEEENGFQSMRLRRGRLFAS
jgi:hypothetical protein